jgi:hypothetical protein
MPTDNCSVTSINCTPQSGALFPAGTTTVQCTARDAAGNTGTCSFTVNVTPVPAFVSSVSPTTGAEGATVNLTINAAGVCAAPTLQITPSDGITVNSVTYLGGPVFASITIAPDAPTTPRILRLVTAGGLSNGVNFTVTLPNGETDQAQLLNGSTYNSAPSTQSLNPTSDITVEAWVFPTSTGGTRSIVAKRRVGGGNNNGGYELRITDLNEVEFLTFNDNGSIRGRFKSSGSQVVVANQWQHISGSYDGSVFRVSLNDTVWTSPQMSNLRPVQGNTDLQIGRGLISNGANNYFIGRIDEVRISDLIRYTGAFTLNRNLTSDNRTRALWKFNGSTGRTDSSLNMNTLTLSTARGEGVTTYR